MAEADIGKAVMAWLSADDWDCYPEAQFHSGGARADIAAVRDGLLWIVECKTTFGDDVVTQAMGWLPSAHFVSIATPRPKKAGLVRHSALFTFCCERGIGRVLTQAIPPYIWEEKKDLHLYVQSIAAPCFHRWAHRGAAQNIAALHPDMKRYQPGSTSNQGYSTPWRRTMEQARDFIRTHPGCTIRAIMEGVEHHYRSDKAAMNSLRFWLSDPVKGGVRIESVAGGTLYYPVRRMEPILYLPGENS